MEVVEIISYYIYEEKKSIEVSFRLSYDADDEVRSDVLSIEEAKEMGFDLIQEDVDFPINEEEDEYSFVEDFFDIETLDEDVLITYLNEYYIVNPDRLPNSELF
ncbi:MAG: hypothetical protein EBS55_13220 [Flavobacteriaceae bacterium]|nr:hypothetical protein [Flavobacteriaceae bacterium]